MARQTANSLLNSLKGKIWLATSALAFFICAFGLISYLVFSLVTDSLFSAVFVPFLFLGCTVMVFGWWLSNEVVGPIEKVTLLAKSLERGVSVTLPKTSGSTETDELLLTLQRGNMQLQNLVGLMDKVSSGSLDVTLAHLQSSDRLSGSFQKLLVKVADSIHAKQELVKMESAIKQLCDEIDPIQNNNLSIEIKTNFPENGKITETLNFLIYRLGDLAAQIRHEAKNAQNSARDALKVVQATVEMDETRSVEINRVAAALKQIPQAAGRFTIEISSSSACVNNSLEKAQTGNLRAQETLTAVSELRNQVREAVKHIGKLGKRSQEIGKIAKSIEDFSQRTNLIALNASVQASETEVRGFTVFTEEAGRLAARAEDMNKQISTLNKSMAVEISEAENALKAIGRDTANLSRLAIETSNSLNELERYTGQFLDIQKKITEHSAGQAAEIEFAFQIFSDTFENAESAAVNLTQSQNFIKEAINSMENLNLTAADFKINSASDEQILTTEYVEPVISL